MACTRPLGMNLGSVRSALCTAATALAVACGGPSAPSPAPVSGEVWPPSNHWAPDLFQVTGGVVEELRLAGLEVVPAERFSGAPFSAGMQRLAIPSAPKESIYLHVYGTPEQARNEASRIRWDGNLESESGAPTMSVLYASTMHFYYRERIIARFGGCDTRVKTAMEMLFGPPVVVTSSTCWTL